jgi:hypothetical protein
MPPRLLGDSKSAGEVGDLARSFGFVDTVHGGDGAVSVLYASALVLRCLADTSQATRRLSPINSVSVELHRYKHVLTCTCSSNAILTLRLLAPRWSLDYAAAYLPPTSSYLSSSACIEKRWARYTDWCACAVDSEARLRDGWLPLSLHDSGSDRYHGQSFHPRRCCRWCYLHHWSSIQRAHAEFLAARGLFVVVSPHSQACC